MNHEHPLITALRTAGPATQRIAESLLSPYYGYTITEAARLADALIEDQTGHTALSDRWIVEDRDGSVEARAAARERTRLRTAIAERINRFDREFRDYLCRELAAGNGAITAEAIVQYIATDGQALLTIINERAETFAVPAI